MRILILLGIRIDWDPPEVLLLQLFPHKIFNRVEIIWIIRMQIRQKVHIVPYIMNSLHMSIKINILR